MTIRVTILKAGVTDAYGIVMVVGTTYTVEDNFGQSLIQQLRASDTDGVFSTTQTQVKGNDPYNIQSSYSQPFTASRNLTDLDDGKMLVSPAAATTLTIPTGLPVEFGCAIFQSGAGQVTIAAATGVTYTNVNSLTKTSGANAVVALVAVGLNTYVLTGSAA